MPWHRPTQIIAGKSHGSEWNCQQWTTTDRATLETRVVPADEFIDTFVSKLRKLLHHDFTAKMQAAFMQQKKESLQEGEVLVIADFSEILVLWFKMKSNRFTGIMNLQQFIRLYVTTS